MFNIIKVCLILFKIVASVHVAQPVPSLVIGSRKLRRRAER
jgi:hypothetical protein